MCVVITSGRSAPQPGRNTQDICTYMKATLFASLVAQAAGFGAMPMMCEDGPLVFDVSGVRAAIDNEDCDEMMATIKAQVEAIPKAPGSDIPSPQCTTAALSMPEIAGMLCEVSHTWPVPAVPCHPTNPMPHSGDQK